MQTKFTDFLLSGRLGRSILGDELFTCTHGRNPAETLVMRARMGETAEHEEAIERFQKEFFVISSITHPNIIKGFDLIREPECLALTMEYAEAGALMHNKKSNTPMAIEDSLRIILQVGDAVCALHREGFIHGNISPRSILVKATGEMKLGDFSRAQLYSSNVALKGGNRLGTPEYASPEYLQDGIISPKHDLYSLALIGYELITGRYPFGQANPLEKMRARLEMELPEILTQVPECPEHLALVLHTALKRDPNERYTSVEEFIGKLIPERKGNGIFAKIKNWVSKEEKKVTPAKSTNSFVSDGGGAVFQYRVK